MYDYIAFPVVKDTGCYELAQLRHTRTPTPILYIKDACHVSYSRRIIKPLGWIPYFSFSPQSRLQGKGTKRQGVVGFDKSSIQR